MFDLDGTLIDSVPDLAAAVDDMLLKLGRKPAGIDPVREWVGNGARCWCAGPWPVASTPKAWMRSKPSTRWSCSWSL
jgi:phosphoglycolate phosphatase-like HAD superfamily hydrolase